MNKMEKIILDNGLTIYFYNEKKRHSTFFQHITLFGGETKDFIIDGKEFHMQDGVAHILEHYVVEDNAKGNFLKLFGEKQMSTNASTSFKMTKFFFDTVENVEYGIKTLLEGIYSPVFDEERLERIKKPILQEIRGKMDNKFYHSNQETLKNCFTDYKFRSIGGTLEDVEKTTLNDIMTCYKAFYQPKNQIIVVAGNFDKDSVLKTIKNVYGQLNIPKYDVKLIKLNEKNEVVKNKSVIYFPTGEEYIEVSYKINLEKFSIREKLNLDFYLNCFFNMFFGVTSPLYKELVDDGIITTGLSCDTLQFNDFLLVSVGSYSSKGDLLESKIKDAFLKLQYFDEEIFEIDKRSSVISLILRNESLYNMIIPFVENVVTFNYPYLDTVSDIEALNYQEFVDMIKAIDFSNNTVTVIKNKEA